MLYTKETARLWPRLLFAASLLDPALTEALRGLLQAGASLTWERSAKTGRNFAALKPGVMAETDYRRVVGTRESPTYPDLGKALVNAGTVAHPWITPVQRSYEALSARIKASEADLAEKGKTLTADLLRRRVCGLLDAHLCARMIASVLAQAGMSATYYTAIQSHTEALQAIYKPGGAIGLWYDWEHAHGRWSVETPDGVVWITEGPFLGEGLELKDYEMGEALRGLDAEPKQQKEVG